MCRIFLTGLMVEEGTHVELIESQFVFYFDDHAVQFNAASIADRWAGGPVGHGARAAQQYNILLRGR